MVDGVGRVDGSSGNYKRDNLAQSRAAGEKKDERVEFSLKEAEEVSQKVTKDQQVNTEEDRIIDIEEAINSSLGFIDVRVAFSIHRESGRVIIQIIDNETNEVLREIPPEELVAKLSEVVELVGLLVDKRG